MQLCESLGPLAQADVVPTGGDDSIGLMILVRHLIAAVVFSLVGVAVLGLSVWMLGFVLPFSMRKEIEEDQNVALGIILGAMVLGMSIIIAAAMLG